MIKTYYLLTKPGIIVGNLITTAGGFAMASKGQVDPWLFFMLFMGLGPVIASACVFNNYIDRYSDAKMSRTKNRPLVKKLIAPWKALLFGSLLGFFGIAILSLFTNFFAMAIAVIGLFIYVVLYSLLKSRSLYATLVGSISGAIPPVVGYSAVTHSFDTGAALLFAILVLWQMPHFFAIAIYRFDDYLAASIPVLPIMKGAQAAKIQMLFYCCAFLGAALLLFSLGYVGKTYALVALVLGSAWIWLCLKGFRVNDDRLWARNMFRLSLLIITAFSLMISIDADPL